MDDKNKLILESTVVDSLLGSTIKIDNFYLKIGERNNLRRPISREYIAKTIDVFTINSIDKIGTFNICEETIKEAINLKLDNRKKLLKVNSNFYDQIQFKDIWIETATGFLLGNLKPISFWTQLIQLIQIFILFIIATMTGNFISNCEILNIEKR